MVTLYLNGNPPWLKVFGDDQKPRVVLVTVLTSLILLLYDGLMVSHVIIHKILERIIITFTKKDKNAHVTMFTLYLQSRTQSPQALWPAVGRQERLWGTGTLITAGFLR